MTVHYHQRARTEIPGYRCMRASIREGVAPCASVPGSTIDMAIGQLLLDTVTPLALEVALTVQAELETWTGVLRRSGRRAGERWSGTNVLGVKQDALHYRSQLLRSPPVSTEKQFL
jgi:hypothetical protein